MNSLKSALKLLAKGEFVCHVRFESEYEALAIPEGQQQAQEWRWNPKPMCFATTN